MKIFDSVWFNGEFGKIGIVVVKNNGKDIRAYIGLAKGRNEQADERMIAHYGTPLYLKTVRLLYNMLEPIPKLNGEKNG